MAGKKYGSVRYIYRDAVSVDNAVNTLQQEGFRNTDISVLFPRE
jgi:hypothetical protein